MSAYIKLKEQLLEKLVKYKKYFKETPPTKGKNSETLFKKIDEILENPALQDPAYIIQQFNDWLRNYMVDEHAVEAGWVSKATPAVIHEAVKTIKVSLEATVVENPIGTVMQLKAEHEQVEFQLKMQQQFAAFQASIQQATIQQIQTSTEPLKQEVTQLKQNLEETVAENRSLKDANNSYEQALTIVGSTIKETGNRELLALIRDKFQKSGLTKLLTGSAASAVAMSIEDADSFLNRGDEDIEMLGEDSSSATNASAQSSRKRKAAEYMDEIPGAKKPKSSAEHPNGFHSKVEEVKSVEEKVADQQKKLAAEALGKLKEFLLPNIAGSKVEGNNRTAVPRRTGNTDFQPRSNIVEKLLQMGLKPNIDAKEKAIIKLYIFVMLRHKYSHSMKELHQEVSGFLNRQGIDMPQGVTDLLAKLPEDDLAVINSVDEDLKKLSDVLKQKNIIPRVSKELSPEEARSYALVYATSAKVAVLNDAHAKAGFEQLAKTLEAGEKHSVPAVRTTCREWIANNHTDLGIAPSLVNVR